MNTVLFPDEATKIPHRRISHLDQPFTYYVIAEHISIEKYVVAQSLLTFQCTEIQLRRSGVQKGLP